jgi:hypothetical protein
MKTIDIDGKSYVPVVERVKELHKLYPNATIQTEVVSITDTRAVVKAIVDLRKESDGFVNFVYSGHSQASWGEGTFGGVALEIAETSAVGRALGFAGIGLLDGIASADEIQKNVGKQTISPDNMQEISHILNSILKLRTTQDFLEFDEEMKEIAKGLTVEQKKIIRNMYDKQKKEVGQ